MYYAITWSDLCKHRFRRLFLESKGILMMNLDTFPSNYIAKKLKQKSAQTKYL